MIASTWLDIAVGVDIHFEVVPTPAGPIVTDDAGKMKFARVFGKDSEDCVRKAMKAEAAECK